MMICSDCCKKECPRRKCDYRSSLYLERCELCGRWEVCSACPHIQREKEARKA